MLQQNDHVISNFSLPPCPGDGFQHCVRTFFITIFVARIGLLTSCNFLLYLALVFVPLRPTTLSFLSPPLLLMIYFDIDHLLNVTQFLQFLQRFDLSADLLFLVQKTYVCFASATYAKQTGLPPHLFTTMAEGETTAQPIYSLQNFGGAVSNALEYNYHLHHCNVLIIMIDTILCFLPFPEFNEFSVLLDLFLNILYIAAEQFPLPAFTLHLSTLKWITKHPFNQG